MVTQNNEKKKNTFLTILMQIVEKMKIMPSVRVELTTFDLQDQRSATEL